MLNRQIIYTVVNAILKCNQNTFTTVVVHGVRISKSASEGREKVKVNEGKPELFSVYLKDEKGAEEYVTDFNTTEEAINAAVAIGKKYHLLIDLKPICEPLAA